VNRFGAPPEHSLNMLLLVRVRPYRDDPWEVLEFRFGPEPQTGRTSALGWEDRGFIGGYEMGIAFPPDWVGNFIYDVSSEENIDRSFEPGTVVNYENQFFLPRQVGLYFMIESIAFGADDAHLLSNVPYELTVID